MGHGSGGVAIYLFQGHWHVPPNTANMRVGVFLLDAYVRGKGAVLPADVGKKWRALPSSSGPPWGKILEREPTRTGDEVPGHLHLEMLSTREVVSRYFHRRLGNSKHAGGGVIGAWVGNQEESWGLWEWGKWSRRTCQGWGGESGLIRQV